MNWSEPRTDEAMSAKRKSSDEVGRHVGALATALRSRGVSVPVSASIDCAQAWAAVASTGDPGLPTEVSALYWAGRTTLIKDPSFYPTYDDVFERFLVQSELQDCPPVVVRRQRLDVLALDSVDEEGAAGSGQASGTDDTQDGGREDLDDPNGDGIRALRYSARERLARADFATLDQAELAEVMKLISQIRVRRPSRLSARRTPSKTHRDQLDLSATVRSAVRSGEFVNLAYTQRRLAPRSLVLLIDVSGSMEPYGRSLICFGHAARRSAQGFRVEVFAIGTRLTDLGRSLTAPSASDALTQASREIDDYSGGTRLGDTLAEFLSTRSPCARDGDVVILSDGWDRGDPQHLSAQMHRLKLLSKRIIWVNPLKASRGYEPIARGMAAALEHVDHFVEGHSLESIQSLVGLLDHMTPADFARAA